MIRFVVDGPGRADHAVAAALGQSRRRATEAFAAGAVRVNGKRARKGDAVAAGDVLEIEATGELAPLPEPEAPLITIFEDAWLLALDKPAGQPSHPLRAGERGTLANALVARYPECAAASADPREAGLAHRLDTGTTGLVLAARSRAVWQRLRETFRARAVRKEYLALVSGRVDEAFTIDLPIEHDRARGGARAGEGLEAVTHVTPERHVGERTLVRCVAETGRIHQVRVHLAARGHPLVGDTRYGGEAAPITGHFLHAAVLELTHPETGARLRLEAPLPADRIALAGL